MCKGLRIVHAAMKVARETRGYKAERAGLERWTRILVGVVSKWGYESHREKYSGSSVLSVCVSFICQDR